MSIKKIKKSITQTEYKKLMIYVNGDNLKEFKRKRFFKIFSLLYFSGMRVNEVTQIKNSHIKEIIENNETIIISHKTKKERILYFSNDAVKELKKYFQYNEDEINDYCITPFNNPQKTFHNLSLISLVNKYMNDVLGDNYTSHSFRQGLITDMASKSINVKIIQSFIGHSNVSTTLNYVNPTENDIKQSLVR